jgi:phospholipid/cholesterol/gamma-HCH transport system substrate-binding protein
MRLALRKALRYNLVAGVALVGLVLLGSAVGGYILANQRLNPPSWVPVVGESHFELRAELETVQGILPGQGQAVNVSGVRVGDIASVDLEEGKAVATMRIEERFARIYPDATVLLRPKTNVKDMVIELDPGSPSAGRRLDSGATIRNDSALSDVNFADFLATLDADTQDYLGMLVQGAGEALGDGGGRDLANTFRRFPPLARNAARASRLVARRRDRLERVMSNFSKIMSELGRHDSELARFVSGSNAVFRRFANQNESLSETIELLPGALQSSNRALERFDRLGRAMRSTFGQLRPTARALGPTLRDLRPFLRDTVEPIRTQLRPFTREARPIAHELREPAEDLSASMPSFHKFTNVLNALFDELAYDPPGDGTGGQGFLFYAPWAAHNTNSTVANQDGIGPLRRGVVLVPCESLEFLESLSGGGRNPLLTTLVELLNAPDAQQAGCVTAEARR